MSVAKRLFQAMLVVLTLSVGAASAAVIVSQTAWFKDWLRGYIEREAGQYLNGQLAIGRLGGNLFFGVELENVGVSMDGKQIVGVKGLGLDYNVFELVSTGMSLDNLRLDEPVIHLRREGDEWSISRLIKKETEEADREGPMAPIAIDAIDIRNASVIVEDTVDTSAIDVPDRIDQINAQLTFKYEPVRYGLEISHLSLVGSNPPITLETLSGGILVRDDSVVLDNVSMRTEQSALTIDGTVDDYLEKPTFNVRMSSERLSIPEIARIVPAAEAVALQPSVDVKLDGPMDRLNVGMSVKSTAGHLIGQLTADAQSPTYSAAGTVSVRNLDVGQIVKGSDRTDVSGDVNLDLVSEDLADLETMRGRVDVKDARATAAGYAVENVTGSATLEGRRVDLTARASAYGAAATAGGRVMLPGDHEPLSYDLRGRAEDVNLRRLPRQLGAPRADTDVSGTYHVKGTTAAGVNQVAGDLTFADSTVAGARVAGGSTAAFSIGRGPTAYDAKLAVSDLDLQRVGEAFGIEALKAERYKGTLNGEITASGRGTAVNEMELKAAGTLVDSTLLGGQITNLSFRADMAQDVVHVTAAGAFTGIDPAIAAEKPEAQGSASGTLDVTATVSGVSQGVTADNVEGTVRVALEPSTVGRIDIERANLDADYHKRIGLVRQLDVVGRDVNVHASGTLALDETGQSDLVVHADSPRLETIGELVDQPIAGIASLDGTVSGNRPMLTVRGTLTGSRVRYGENGALSISTKYDARIPNLAYADAEVSADSTAAFLSVAGQNINEVAAKTTYASGQIDFDVTAAQPQRTLQIAGTLTPHPSHQEVHLQSLALDSQGVQWELAPQSEALIQYGEGTTAVKGLTLVNGTQQISADGTFGANGDGLRVGLNDIDLATVDAILLRPPQLSGRLNASATLQGTPESPRVDAQFQVTQGGFRDFKYESLAGTITSADRGANLDARLQQNAKQWITAKGLVPTSLVRSSNQPSDTLDRISLAVDSSPIDLGLVQGFTTAVTEVTGTLEAHVQVSGTVDDPEPTGAITIQDGAMTVAASGVRYTNIAGQLDLEGDRVRTDLITVLDNEQNALTLTGALAVDARRVGEVELYVNAEDFKLFDNELGNMRAETALEIRGDLKAPRVEGYFGVNSGRVELDEFLALTEVSAYPTEGIGGNAAESGEAEEEQGLFESATMDVHVIVPNDLLVRASQLQPGDAPISVGSLNVTLGGDLRATKDPGGQVRLTGEVNTVRGTYDFQGRRLEIMRDGTVQFVGLEELNPTLNLRTRREIRGVEVRVDVRGTLQEPEIVLSSTPPLDEADILALIVFNQPVNELGAGQQVSLAQRAQAMASGVIAGQLAESIGDVLDLDTFEINLAPESGSGPTVTFGEQIGGNVFVRVEQGIGDSSTTNFILEYELTNWMRLQTNVIQGSETQQSMFRRAQSTGTDLIFLFSF